MATPDDLYFDIYRDGTLLLSARSGAAAIKIGSHPKSHLHIEDEAVSRVHAVIEKNDDGVSVIDLGSGRGTFVSGERVNKRQLTHADIIRVGTTEIHVFFRDERAAQAAAATAARATDPRTKRQRDEVLYARRFLARPAATDGSVEIALLFNDFVMAEELYNPARTVTVGEDTECDFVLEGLGASHKLIDAGAGDPVLCVTPQMEGDVYIGRERMTLGDAAAPHNGRIPITQNTRARVLVGPATFFVHHSTTPALALPLARGEMRGAAFFVLSAILHALLLALILLLPPGMGSLGLDGFNADDRFVQLLMEDAMPEPEPEIETDDGDEEEEQAETEEGEEGRAGDEEEEETDLRMAIEGDLEPGDDIELARELARETVQDRGALQVLNQQGPTSLFGDTANGYDAVMAIGAVSGSEIGSSYGTRGLGAYGGGLSGGGRQLAGIGSGAIALRGRSSGSNSELGRNLRGVRDREASQPTVTVGRPDIDGQLDRAIIQRVIREHRREVRACYEA
ncbi:MAG: hypothetical protein ACJA1R_002684, partial [Flavobacteriales bacterium]